MDSILDGGLTEADHSGQPNKERINGCCQFGPASPPVVGWRVTSVSETVAEDRGNVPQGQKHEEPEFILAAKYPNGYQVSSVGTFLQS